MVSKLLLAVEEIVLGCDDDAITAQLLRRYRDIQAGLGFNKSPEAYGAFPTDPYSHTPKGQGARQPGMTGLVKEEIIARKGELCLTIEDGCLVFNPKLFDTSELLKAPSTYEYVDVTGHHKSIYLPANTLAYTCCQTPIVLQTGQKDQIKVTTSEAQEVRVPGARVDSEISRHIFLRDGQVEKLWVQLKVD